MDSIIVSIGQKLKIEGLEELSLNKWGNIDASETAFTTNLDGVFAGGDATNNGAGIAIEAINDGKLAAKVITSYLEGHIVPVEKPYYVTRNLGESDFVHVPKVPRSHMGHEHPDVRKTNFEEVVHGFSENETHDEAMRCLECGCHDYFECQLISNANQSKVNPERFDGDRREFAVEDPHPYIHRDVNKCILCGMCVRVCEEVVGQGILGLVDRGFGSRVLPSLGSALEDTDCIACGQCVGICPTGALIEKLPVEKPVPVKPNKTHTTCAKCSTGCQVTLETKGSLMLRALPHKGLSVNKGLLCKKGRFEFGDALSEKRLIVPHVKKGAEQVETTFKEATLQVARRAQSIHLVHGANAMGIVVSDQMTLEEIHMIQDLGKRLLNTDQIYAYGLRASGVNSVIGTDGSTNSIEELETTDTIVSFGLNLSEEHALLGLKIRQAVKQGAQWSSIQTQSASTDSWATTHLTSDCIDQSAIQFLKAVMELKGINPEDLSLPSLLLELISHCKSEDYLQIADQYVKAKKAMIVFNEMALTELSEQALAYSAQISGKIGNPRNGFIKVRRHVNTQGLSDLGIRVNSGDLERDLHNGTIKGLLVFGETLPNSMLESLEFLMVMDRHMTETAIQADVVLPMAAIGEVSGHVTSTDRRIQRVKEAVKPPSGKSNFEILKEVMNCYGKQCHWKQVDEVFFDLCVKNDLYHGAYHILEVADSCFTKENQRVIKS